MQPPSASRRAISREADLAACRAHLRAGSRSFLLASMVLPRWLRERATALYAFCRLADDAVDHGGGVPALTDLHRRLDRIYRGRPADDPAERAFAALVAEHGLPRVLPEALLEGFAWDLEGRRYSTIEDLENYGARVAGSVGAMMTHLMGVRDRTTLARACDLGVAMQLSNIARDVAEDARAGRLYLPESWLREAGIASDALLDHGPVWNARLRSVLERLLAHADRLYSRAETGLAGLPLSCRPGIYAARLLYAEIGHAVLTPGHDPLAVRSVVTPARKASLIGRATWGWAAAGQPSRQRPLQATASLVEATATAAAPNRSRSVPLVGGRTIPGGRIAWLIDLFERLERLDRGAAVADGN